MLVTGFTTVTAGTVDVTVQVVVTCADTVDAARATARPENFMIK